MKTTDQKIQSLKPGKEVTISEGNGIKVTVEMSTPSQLS
jgi:hypothetical protein